MYSSPSFIPDSLAVWDIEINGKTLNIQDLHPKTIDYIIAPLDIYQQQIINGNNLYQSHIQQFLKRVQIESNHKFFTQSVSKQQFCLQYRRFLEKLLDRKIHEVKVYKSSYTVTGSKFLKSGQDLFLHATN